MPSPSDPPSPNTTEASSYSGKPCPTTPRPLPQYVTAQSLPPKGEVLPLNQFWQWESHPIKIPPTQSTHHAHHPEVQIFSQHLNPHGPALLPAFITQNYSPRSRSAEERYEAQQVQSAYTMETTSWPAPSHRTVAVTSDVPSSFAPTDRPASYPSNAMYTTTFTGYQGGVEPSDNGDRQRSRIYPNPPIHRIEEPKSFSQAPLHVSGDM